jgi:hypothetical protein
MSKLDDDTNAEIEITKGDVDGETKVWLAQDHGATREMVLLGSHRSPIRALRRAQATLDRMVIDMHERIRERQRLATLPA